MKNEKDVLPVLYKKIGDDVIALFPTVAFTFNYDECMSYMRVGQHSSASVSLFYNESATPEEYENLHQELTQIYDEVKLKIIKRVSYKMTKKRYDELSRLYNEQQ